MNDRRIYDLENITPNKELALKTGCKLEALHQIVKKGEGAYYSSGSRPNQTPQSGGLARLASSLTSGKSAAVDYDIIKKGCNHTKRAFMLANKSRKMYKYGHSKTKTTSVWIKSIWIINTTKTPRRITPNRNRKNELLSCWVWTER